MRLNSLPIDQVLMCMSKSQPGDLYPVLSTTSIKTEPEQVSSSESSRASSGGGGGGVDDNAIIEFGPIKVKPRKRPAPTLATGRRSKYEVLTVEEEQKRNVRRARNRAAAERVRLSRLSVEQKLLEQIAQLEQQEENLSKDVQTLQHQKLHLETRLFTHEQMCTNATPISTDFNNFFPMENFLTSFQQTDKLVEIDFDDLFFSHLTNGQIQQNFSESLSTLLPVDDLNDLLMNS